jgi:hypothetical protein
MSAPVVASFLQETTVAQLSCAYAYDASGNVEYVGRARPGTAKSDPLWQIQKFTYGADGVTDVQWAGGLAAFSHIWNNRAALSYS